MKRAWAAWMLAACGGGDPTFIVEGTVVDVRSDTEIVVDHAPVVGLMDAMVMPFTVKDPGQIAGLGPGDRIVARLVVADSSTWLEKVRKTGHDPSFTAEKPDAGPGPLRAGQTLPAVSLEVGGGERWTVGEGQGVPTVVTFLYTTCPLPEFCPATVLRLQGLQKAMGDSARIVAVTIDPAKDTPEVLAGFAANVGADPKRWRFARASDGDFGPLLARAALMAAPGTAGRVEHNTRFLVLDAQGRLIERYDDNRWPEARVVEQLRTGGPPAPAGSDGTSTPASP